MAAEVLSDISGALATTFAPELIRIWNRQANLALNLDIKSGGGQGGGKAVNWDVETSGAAAASFSEGSDVGSGELVQDAVKGATLPWGQYRSAFQLSNLEINAARSNISNATALEDMIGERFIGAISSIVALMNLDMFSGDGTDGSGYPNIIGLDTALLATGNYAGVTSSSTWTGNLLSNGAVARPLTMKLLAQMEQAIFTLSGLEPDLIVTTAGIHTNYESLFEATRRTMDSGQGPIPSYQGSTGRLFWRGKPVIRDRNATTQCVYMLRKDMLDLRVLPWSNTPMFGGETREGFSSNGMDMQKVAIPFHVYPLARNGSAVKFCVEVYAQLRVARTNAHGILSDISET